MDGALPAAIARYMAFHAVTADWVVCAASALGIREGIGDCADGLDAGALYPLGTETPAAPDGAAMCGGIVDGIEGGIIGAIEGGVRGGGFIM